MTTNLRNRILVTSRQLNKKILESDMYVLKDSFEIHFDRILVWPESYMYKPLEKFILESYQHGFMDYFEKTITDSLPKLEVNEEPTVLSMYLLSAGFYLWLFAAAIAGIVFILEQVVNYLSKRSKRKRLNQSQPDEPSIHESLPN